ncbi:hypothetical protein KIPB_003871, partial [Kipferlia bialata]
SEFGKNSFSYPMPMDQRYSRTTPLRYTSASGTHDTLFYGVDYTPEYNGPEPFCAFVQGDPEVAALFDSCMGEFSDKDTQTFVFTHYPTAFQARHSTPDASYKLTHHLHAASISRHGDAGMDITAASLQSSHARVYTSHSGTLSMTDIAFSGLYENCEVDLEGLESSIRGLESGIKGAADCDLSFLLPMVIPVLPGHASLIVDHNKDGNEAQGMGMQVIIIVEPDELDSLIVRADVYDGEGLIHYGKRDACSTGEGDLCASLPGLWYSVKELWHKLVEKISGPKSATDDPVPAYASRQINLRHTYHTPSRYWEHISPDAPPPFTVSLSISVFNAFGWASACRTCVMVFIGAVALSMLCQCALMPVVLYRRDVKVYKIAGYDASYCLALTIGDWAKRWVKWRRRVAFWQLNILNSWAGITSSDRSAATVPRQAENRSLRKPPSQSSPLLTRITEREDDSGTESSALPTHPLTTIDMTRPGYGTTEIDTCMDDSDLDSARDMSVMDMAPSPLIRGSRWQTSHSVVSRTTSAVMGAGSKVLPSIKKSLAVFALRRASMGITLYILGVCIVCVYRPSIDYLRPDSPYEAVSGLLGMVVKDVPTANGVGDAFVRTAGPVIFFYSVPVVLLMVTASFHLSTSTLPPFPSRALSPHIRPPLLPVKQWRPATIGCLMVFMPLIEPVVCLITPMHRLSMQHSVSWSKQRLSSAFSIVLVSCAVLVTTAIVYVCVYLICDTVDFDGAGALLRESFPVLVTAGLSMLCRLIHYILHFRE